MNRCWLALPWWLAVVAPVAAADFEVTDLRAVHRHGQTFITWKDAAEGEAGGKLRYSLYRSEQPITAANLAKAELCYHGVLNQSGKLFGSAFNQKDRLDPAKPLATIEEGGQPLSAGSGLAVRTARKDGKSYYAVVVTDEKYAPLGKVTPGKSATTEAVEEKVAPIQPIKLHDSKMRGQYSPQTSITGTKGLPLAVELHASQGQGGGAGEYGDYYLYFATPDMGWRDGLPGVFSVRESRGKTGNTLQLQSRDAIEHPSGTRAMETYWFGYLGIPQGATHKEPRAYPFTERRMVWVVDWVVKRYAVDPERITAGGGSMGAWGSTTFAFRHPELFAAVYPNRPRTRQKGLPSLAGEAAKGKPVLMADGKTDYFDRMDMVKFAAEQPGELPFYAWCCGRRDGFASWQEQVDMARALTAARRGFAFAWNDGDHSSGAQPMAKVLKYFPPEKFARNQSYPAFGNSSLDQNPGKGDPKDGDLEGGMNLGFLWKDISDEAGKWSVRLSNDLAKDDMTVDVTPRRCQKFQAKPGETFQWTASTGGSGTVTADKQGLVTVAKFKLKPGAETVLTISR
ncbi:MAG: alpha/beta hydrolase [Planctomycetia bacterium]|nr:alpha/beta hydrolase [Planctomycetia bacterium]